MTMSETKFVLKDTPDGFGFIYGVYRDGEDSHRVDILPPINHWNGDIQLSGYKPHKTDWILFIDGEEVARATSRSLLEHGCDKALRLSGKLT